LGLGQTLPGHLNREIGQDLLECLSWVVHFIQAWFVSTEFLDIDIILYRASLTQERNIHLFEKKHNLVVSFIVEVLFLVQTHIHRVLYSDTSVASARHQFMI
jgi:hypothetical protein